jgi:hypothetical protein
VTRTPFSGNVHKSSHLEAKRMIGPDSQIDEPS